MSSRAMSKALLLTLTIPLLISLGTAAPVVDTQVASDPIQARALTCQTIFGEGIRAGDCALVLDSMERMPTTTTDPVTGKTSSLRAVFSRGGFDDRFRMPQRFVVGTCAVLVDLARPRESIVSNWAFAAGGAHAIVEQCALTAGTGGFGSYFGFETMVMNPRDTNDMVCTVWDTCSRLIDDSSHLMNWFASCMPSDLQAAVASSRAGVGSSSSIKTE